MADDINAFFASLADKVMSGGCDRCEAEQRLHEEYPGAWVLVVAHDSDYPFLRARSDQAPAEA